jgi:hypothetical protein
MDAATNQATLAAIREALSGPATVAPDDLAKATATTQGISTSTLDYGYNLEAPAKSLIPVLTPERNEIPRQTGGFGTGVNWKAFTGLNTTTLSPGVAEGGVGTVPSVTMTEFLASYKTLGFPGTVTYDAIMAAQKGRGGSAFDDPFARGTLQTLQTTMLGEEATIIGGNVTALGAVGTLTYADTIAAASGVLTASTTYYYAVAALTLKGYMAQVTGHASTDAIGEGTGTTGSHATTGSGAGSTATIVNWAAKRGAVAYNVYSGTTATVYYAGTVTTNTWSQTALCPTTGNVPNSADQTADSLVFNGYIPTISLAANNGYFKDMAGGTLTADNAGGVVEIDTMLKSLWDNSRIGPEKLLVNSQEALTITKAVLTAGTTGATRVMVAPSPSGNGILQAGFFVASYLNKFAPTNPIVKIEVHPNVPPGTVIAVTKTLPGWFPNAEVSSVWTMDVRQEYTQYNFAETDRTKRFGVYVSEVLKCYLPAANGIIAGIHS